MDNLQIEASLVSPKTILDKQKGVFSLVGNSYMSNPTAYYEVVITWLNEYIKDPLPVTNFVMDLEYINTATVKMLNEVVRILISLRDKGKTIHIEWYYQEDDEDMIELGKQYELLNKFKFEWKLK